jgi:hypothetical protein
MKRQTGLLFIAIKRGYKVYREKERKKNRWKAKKKSSDFLLHNWP